MRKEKFIINRYSTRKGHTKEVTAYVVYIPYYENGERKNYNKNFPVKDYLTPSDALKAAKRERDLQLPLLEDISRQKKKDVLKSTVGDCFAEIDTYFPVRMKTSYYYGLSYQKYIKPYCGEKLIESITREDVMNSLNECSKNCVQKNVGRLKTVWHKILQVAINKGIPATDWTVSLKMPKSERDFEHSIDKRKNITEEEFQAFLQAMKEYGNYSPLEEDKIYNRDIVIYLLKVMRATGVRPAEGKAIHKSNILFDKVDGIDVAIIKIVSSIGSTRDEMITERETKTASSVRDVYLFGKDIDMLKEAINYSKYELMFSSYNGEPFTSSGLSDYIRHVSQKCGIQFNAYLLRHSFASDLYRAGQSPVDIKELMGHTDEAMSMNVYAGSDFKDRVRAAYQRRYKQEND